MNVGRSYWSGRIVILGSSVNIPISLYSVMDKAGTGLCQRSLCCESTVNYKKVCSKCKNELTAGQIGKGYILNNEIIPLDEQQLEAIKPQGSDTIEIVGTLDTFPQTYDTDKKYWLAVNEVKDKKIKQPIADTQSRDAYTLLTKALGMKTLIGRAVMRNKEYVVAVNEVGGRLLLSCLYHNSSLKPMLETGYDDVQAENVKVVKKFIKELPKANLEDFEDLYSKNLMEMILGKEVVLREGIITPPVSNAISMFA